MCGEGDEDSRGTKNKLGLPKKKSSRSQSTRKSPTHKVAGSGKAKYPKPTQTPFNFISESPGLPNWEAATIDVMSRKYGQQYAGFRAAEHAYQTELGKLSGSARKDYARDMFGKVREEFYVRESKFPSFEYSDTEIENLKKGSPPQGKTGNLHHSETLARNPARAVDPANLIYTEGGPRGAVQRGSYHHKLHVADPAVRRVPSPPATVTSTRATDSKATDQRAVDNKIKSPSPKAPKLGKARMGALGQSFLIWLARDVDIDKGLEDIFPFPGMHSPKANDPEAGHLESIEYAWKDFAKSVEGLSQSFEKLEEYFGERDPYIGLALSSTEGALEYLGGQLYAEKVYEANRTRFDLEIGKVIKIISERQELVPVVDLNQEWRSLIQSGASSQEEDLTSPYKLLDDSVVALEDVRLRGLVLLELLIGPVTP